MRSLKRYPDASQLQAGSNMAIELQETFTVAAPIDRVWQFMMNPENVAACMPGASLTELIDDKKFVGSVKVKIGAITAKYSGTITYTTADEAEHVVVMLVEAKEKGGGTVSGTITTKLVALSDCETQVECESSVDMTGRIVQVGRGMIEGVAGQIIGKFVKNVKTLLEVEPVAAQPQGADGTAAAAEQPAPTPPPQLDDGDDAINIIAVVWKVIWDGIKNFFKKLFGRG
jgi:hypothetical protein